MARTVKNLKLLLWQLPLYLFLVWGLGFFLYYSSIGTPDEDPVEKAEAIIVWTGGAGRLDTAIDLLKDGKAQRLLISGVHPDVADGEIRRMTDTATTLFDCCIDLDRTARNTIGNARESAAWARSHAFKNLLLVTADYHMPRSLILMRRSMPEASVQPVRVSGNASFRYLLVEYNKYLITLISIV